MPLNQANKLTNLPPFYRSIRQFLRTVAFFSIALLGAQGVLASGAPISLGWEDNDTGLLRQVAVFGDDNREPLSKNLNALAQSIGLISSETEKTLCTGFCVGRRTVATAAHCLFRTAGERPPELASFSFLIGSINNRRSSVIFGHPRGNHRQHVIAGSTALRVSPPIDATRDWALIRLEKPICDDQALLVDPSTPAQINRLASQRRLLNIGFHGDRKDWRLAVSKSCSTPASLSRSGRRQLKRDFSDVDNLVLHECDTGLASSGSPLLALAANNSLRVVAMNVGSYQQTRYLLTGRSVTRRFKPATIANTAISGRAFADHVLSFARSDILSERSSVRELQSALNKIGLDAGPVDGIFGAQTRGALIAFEQLDSRPPVGLATRQILGVIKRYR